ncbi:MAG TPA: proline--tRNA ligase, partial [Clostridiaceae bacterium]|nr:proline--tRNA ligase [Clostridiaceae bacterium]
IGPRDIEKGHCIAVTRDNRAKTEVKLDQVGTEVPRLLEELNRRIYERAKTEMESRIYPRDNWDDFVRTMGDTPGFILAAWCGSEDCEARVKEETTATSRCMAEGEPEDGSLCVVCGKPARHMVYWGKAY